MSGIKSLIKDSVFYGGSTFLVKMISWLLTSLFTYTLVDSDFGVMTNLYAYVALIIVGLTFGMETGFFRFANQKDQYRDQEVYSTALLFVAGLTLIFLLLVWIFLPQIRPWVWHDDIPDTYIRLVLLILSIDTLSALPFAWLRYKKKTKKFGAVKLLNVLLYTIFCLFFLLVCPSIHERHPQWVRFWNADARLSYVFISNLLASVLTLIFLLPELTAGRWKWNYPLAKKMVRYAFPLMIMGLAGVSNQVVDKIIFPLRYPDSNLWDSELGIYSACFKLALILMMFTQAFRYAYEPFVFEKSKDADARHTYARIMKYFIQLALLVFLLVVFYLDLIKYFIHSSYFAALPIVPVALLGELLFAVYFNLSIWYKLSGKTYWGAIFSCLGLVTILAVSYLFIPRYSYHACVWAIFAGNATMTLLSWWIGKKHYPIPYDWKTISLYTGLAALLYVLSRLAPIPAGAPSLAFNTLLIGIYIALLLLYGLPRKNKPAPRS
jgi:O-antigen/teichoic acid export membrane protein